VVSAPLAGPNDPLVNGSAGESFILFLNEQYYKPFPLYAPLRVSRKASLDTCLQDLPPLGVSGANHNPTA